MKLDLLDKKILSVLNEDVRMPCSQIAKKIHSSTEVVNYRINKLIENNIIQNFITNFDLGYNSYKILLSFSKFDKNAKTVINDALDRPCLNWITTCTGSYDLIFTIMSKDMEEFNTILQDILAKIGEYVSQYVILFNVKSYLFGHRYLLNSTLKQNLIFNKKEKIINFELNEKDKKIAKSLYQDARKSLTQISIESNLSLDIVRYRFSKMKKSNFLVGGRLILNSSKLGYNRYEVFIGATNLTKNDRNKFYLFGLAHTNVEYFSECAGNWDFEYTIHLKNNIELREFILEFKKEFSYNIKKIDTLILFETNNFIYYPKELL